MCQSWCALTNYCVVVHQPVSRFFRPHMISSSILWKAGGPQMPPSFESFLGKWCFPTRWPRILEPRAATLLQHRQSAQSSRTCGHQHRWQRPNLWRISFLKGVQADAATFFNQNFTDSILIECFFAPWEWWVHAGAPVACNLATLSLCQFMFFSSRPAPSPFEDSVLYANFLLTTSILSILECPVCYLRGWNDNLLLPVILPLSVYASSCFFRPVLPPPPSKIVFYMRIFCWPQAFSPF